MRFGEIPVGEAEGAILAHSLRFGATAFKKGRVLGAADIAALRAAGIGGIVAARLDPGDLRR
jgi:molybdenum cofactor cytidylyltransferase